MKKWLILAGVVLILFTGIYLALSFHAVKFIETRIQKVIGPELTIAQVKVRITHLAIHGIRFEDARTKQAFLRIEEMRIYPDLFSFLKRRFRIRECVLLRPHFFLYRTREGELIGPGVVIPKEEKDGEFRGEEKRGERKLLTFGMERLRIVKGSVDFEDRRAGETFGQIQLREVGLNVERIEFPSFSSRSPVELKGKMKGRAKTGEIDVKGWVDFRNSDLEASIKMKEVELKVFEPYYQKRVSAEIESGYLNMDAHLSVKERMVDIPVKLEVADLRIKEGGTIFYIPAKMLSSRLKEKGNRIGIQFQIKGRLGDPRFRLEEVFMMRIGFGLAEAIGLPVKAVEAGGFFK